MALELGNILKITDYQTYLGQATQNVFFYRVTALPTPPEGQSVYEFICERFDVGVCAKMVLLQHNSAFHRIVRVDNLSNGIDFFELATDRQGTVGGEGASSFEALNFVLRRSTLLTRNGSKRLGALPEDIINANSYVGSAPTMALLVAAFASPLVTPDVTPDPFAEPVIVGRSLYTTPEGNEAYELDLTKINPIASAGFTAVSTQRSRKAGKGI